MDSVWSSYGLPIITEKTLVEEYIDQNKAKPVESNEESESNAYNEFYTSVVEAVSEDGSGLTASMTASLIRQKLSLPAIRTKGYLLDLTGFPSLKSATDLWWVFCIEPENI